ncbi:hypothetical protein [Tunicatimonas pelagia]|uniref:hypothetical protein n=1 Tax=Tunicatimonas pelagia TaxID=931531 RepID=UPI00266604F5|nr:hypothetical protein [Tunicatimonas pelagia]WKN45351.1 hypothetical protein P0M28_10305 [Tunicatimonas pelagia]
MIKRKIEASSLIEVIVGMVLISLVMGFAMMIYINVSSSANFSSQLRYQLQLNDLAQETRQQQSFFNETWQESTDSEVVIRKIVQPHPQSQDGWLIRLEAVGPERSILATHQIIVYAP